MTDPLDGRTVTGHWAFVHDQDDERGGGFVAGEFLLRDDGVLLRRMGMSSSAPDADGRWLTNWTFGPWRAVPWWEGGAVAGRAASALRRHGYDLYEPGPVAVHEDSAGPVPTDEVPPRRPISRPE